MENYILILIIVAAAIMAIGLLVCVSALEGINMQSNHNEVESKDRN